MAYQFKCAYIVTGNGVGSLDVGKAIKSKEFKEEAIKLARMIRKTRLARG